MIMCKCGRGKYNDKLTDKCAYCEYGLDAPSEEDKRKARRERGRRILDRGMWNTGNHGADVK